MVGTIPPRSRARVPKTKGTSRVSEAGRGRGHAAGGLQRTSNRYFGNSRADQLGNFPGVGSSLHDDLIRRLEAFSNECLDTLSCNGNASDEAVFPTFLWVKGGRTLIAPIQTQLREGLAETLESGSSGKAIFAEDHATTSELGMAKTPRRHVGTFPYTVQSRAVGIRR